MTTIIEHNIQTGETVEREALPGEIPVIPDSKKLSDELAALAVQYKADIQMLQLSWLSAVVANSTQETTKKAAYTADIAARKTQYAADVAATKAKYT